MTVGRFLAGEMCLLHIEVAWHLAVHTDPYKVNMDDSRWFDIHTASGCLKLYFRELPTPLFTYGLYDDFISAAAVSVNDELKYERIKEVISRLPERNQSVLTVLMQHLTR